MNAVRTITGPIAVNPRGFGFVTDEQAGAVTSSPADQVAGLAIDGSGRIYGAGFTRDAHDPANLRSGLCAAGSAPETASVEK